MAHHNSKFGDGVTALRHGGGGKEKQDFFKICRLLLPKRGGWRGKRWRLRMLKLRRRNIWLLKKQREVASKPSASTTPGSATISLFGIGSALLPKTSVPSGTGTTSFTAAGR
mmetsp:Transcript_55712/g.66962  ORF Transcript_55712/g.66962 Transcript_55712/m.66962 type:complete len:112 (+) Transcript_55712:36-371(+)